VVQVEERVGAERGPQVEEGHRGALRFGPHARRHGIRPSRHLRSDDRIALQPRVLRQQHPDGLHPRRARVGREAAQRLDLHVRDLEPAPPLVQPAAIRFAPQRVDVDRDVRPHPARQGGAAQSQEVLAALGAIRFGEQLADAERRVEPARGRARLVGREEHEAQELAIAIEVPHRPHRAIEPLLEVGGQYGPRPPWVGSPLGLVSGAIAW
jgi:hypothetical protein